MKINFVTSNQYKFKEFTEISGLDLARVNLDLEEIQAVDVGKVAEHKARQAFAIIKKPVIVADTGLYCEAWKGLPGALAKWFDQTIGYAKLCNLLGEDRAARAQTVIGYYDQNGYRAFVGEVQGEIAKSPRGDYAFGWDVIFAPKGCNQTFAEMGKNEKNKISMLKIAIDKFKDFLQE